MISYPNYKFCFPIKALGMYAHLYGDEILPPKEKKKKGKVNNTTS